MQTHHVLARGPWHLVALALALVLATGSAEEATANNRPPEGFRALWNGVDLDGWWGLGTEDPTKIRALSPADLRARKQASLADITRHWQGVDGELRNDGQGLYLTTDEELGDFELLIDYCALEGCDSGVYLRGIPQVQIWDTTEAGGKWGVGADKGSGGLWNNGEGVPGRDPLVHADRPFGEWNHLRIVCVGERVSVWLNEQLVVDHARLLNYFDPTMPLPRKGPIQLQTHGGEMRWRNVFVRDIDADEANRILAGHGEEGFESVWNGKDFSGWAGPVDNYEVVGGALRCKEGKGGTIFTEAEFADFVLRLEILLPPGGNNGLALRYPGKGDTAYKGMCELQVLENTHPKFAKLDPRQYHASVYGQVAARRGYQRPVGEWNFQEVTVQGSTIKVELNGTVILDADLATVTELMYATEKFQGRDRAAGHFGFAGHNDPVSFRNIRIRRLGE